MATDFDIFEDVFGSAEESDMINNIIQDKKIILTPTSINMNPLGYNRNDYPVIDTYYRGWQYIPATAPFNCETVSRDSVKQKLQEFGDRYTFITTYLRYWIDVKTCDDYISIKEYKVYADDAEQVALARKRGMPVLIAGGDTQTSAYQRFLTNNTGAPWVYCIPDVEFRIYRDRTWSMVVRYDFDDGTSRYFCVHPEIRKALLSSKYIEGLNVPTLYKKQNHFKEQNEKALREVTHQYLTSTYDKGLPYYKEVYSDADIKECAVADTRSHLILAKTLLSDTSIFSIIDEYNKECLDESSNDELFGVSLRNEINNFFGVFNEENSTIWQEFKQRFPSSNSDGIRGPSFLVHYITCTGHSVKVAAAKDERANNIWPTLHWPTAVNGAIWERRGDDIICTRTFNSYKAAFVYNTNTKVRYVLKQYGTGKIKTLIPSLRSALLSLFELDDALYLNLWNNVSIKELFANSNVGWILDNTSSFAENFQIIALKHRYDATKVKLSDEINGTTIGSTALAILATTGEPILEQLLKNKLFNLYFALLDDRAHGESYGYDMDKEKGNNARPTSCSFGYHGSAGSLKKMFGMTLDQLKVYDASITIEQSTYGSYSYAVPRTYDFPKFLNVTACNQLDIKTFTAAIQPDMGKNLQEIMKHREFDELLNNNNPKQRVEFVTKYAQHTTEWRGLHDFWEGYADYLKMRKGLRVLSERSDNNIEYSDKWYPEKPGEAKKFIYYRAGMHLPGDNVHIYSPEEFEKRVHREYDDDTGNVSMVTDEQGKIVGAEINMSPKTYLEFLHNEASTWYNLIKNEEQNALFQAAVDRLKKYEYTDEKLGLSVVAPTSASDVQNEGSVLSHCVASFVEPIINGTENVVFIRRNDKLAEPYYTMAISPSGDIEQIHCYRNGGLDEQDQASAFKTSQRDVYNKFFDIKAFIRKWAKNKKGIISEASIKDRYGALCAHR